MSFPVKNLHRISSYFAKCNFAYLFGVKGGGRSGRLGPGSTFHDNFVLKADSSTKKHKSLFISLRKVVNLKSV